MTKAAAHPTPIHPAADSTTPSRLRPMIALLLLVTTLTLGRLCTYEFIWWDDNETLHQNPNFNPPTIPNILSYWSHPHMSLYIPVTYTVWGGLSFIAQLHTGDEQDIK